MMVLLGMLPLAAGAGCEGPATTTDELTAAIEEAEGTISTLDIPGFKEATDRVRGVLPCLDDPLTRGLAAGVHRCLGIRAFGDRDPDAALYFAAARALEPSYRLPPEVIPEGNPVREAYEQADLSIGGDERAPEPAAGNVQFDGRTTRSRPAAWPTIFQRVADDGAVVETAYLMPTDAIPPYPERAVPVEVPPEEPPLPEPDPRRGRTALLAGTVGAAVVAGALYGTAGLTRARFDDPGTADVKLDGLRTTTNGLVVGAAVAGATSVGLGVGLAVSW